MLRLAETLRFDESPWCVKQQEVNVFNAIYGREPEGSLLGRTQQGLDELIRGN
jgi:hypothetical protein